jgi:hypothetical protein
MQTTAVTAKSGDARNWMRMVLLLAGFALLIVSAVQPAGAEEKRDLSDIATNQRFGCALAGGDSDVDVDRTVEGVRSTSVTCKGGLLDGVTCENTPSGTTCKHPDIPNQAPDAGSQWPVYEIVGVLETGSMAQITEAVADLDTAPAGDPGTADSATDSPSASAAALGAGPSMVNPDNLDHAKSKAKGKSKGKKGKKGGKGRKR